MTRFKFIFVVLFFFICFLPLRILADMDEMVLNQDTTAQNRQRSEVRFPHGLHMNSLECLDCHHVYEEGKNILDEGELYEGNPDTRCNSCHDKDASMDTTKAFHHKCMGCHIKATNKKAHSRNPGMCGSCHRNKDSRSPLLEKDND